jgi:hypothetical protein
MQNFSYDHSTSSSGHPVYELLAHIARFVAASTADPNYIAGFDP